MKAIVQNKIASGQQHTMPTLSGHHAQKQADRMAKMAKEQRTLKVAQAGTDNPNLHYTLNQRSELLGRRMDRLAGRAEKLQNGNDA